MAVIKSGATTDQLTIDPTSKAARVTNYTSAGVEGASGPADLAGTLVALNAINIAAQVKISGLNGAGMNLASGTLIGTIIAEASYDGGTNWVSTFFLDSVTKIEVNTIVFGGSNPATYKGIICPSGSTHVRVRVSAFTSGTANCTLTATANEENKSMQGVQFNTALPTLATGQQAPIQSDASGRPLVVAIGTLADNATNPTAKQATIPVRANAAAPAWTEGNVVPLSSDLAGRLRIGGTLAADLGKAEDAVHATADVGVMALGVRQDIGLVNTSASGDYGHMTLDKFGNTRVNSGLAPTYHASIESLSFLLVAATTKQYVVVYHPATVAERILIRKVTLTIESSTVASVIRAHIARLNGTTAPSGGTAITILLADQVNTVLSASDVIQSLPTTAGSVTAGQIAGSQSYNLGITAAPTDVSGLTPIVLYDAQLHGGQPLTIRTSTAEGYAVEITGTVGTTLVATIEIIFTVE